MADIDSERLAILEAIAKAAQRWLRARKRAIHELSVIGTPAGAAVLELSNVAAELAKITADYELLAAPPK